MKSSIFATLLALIWPKLGLFIQEKINGSKKKLTYLHKERLEKVYSPDGKWESSSANTRRVAADMVALDSPLPLKKRSSISNSNGNLPKIGMKTNMKESEINAIDMMQAQLNQLEEGSARYKQKRKQILTKLANDGEACSVGIDERNEYNYLMGISEGVVLIPADDEDKENTGLGLRVNYGYNASNIFGVNDPDDITGDDIENVFSRADANGDTPAVAMISKSLLSKIKKSRWARKLAADYKEQVYTDENKLPVPTTKTFLEAFESEYGCPLMVIDRTVLTEKNGQDKPAKPFNQNRIIFLPDAETDGSLVYGTLAEANHPVEGVEYSTVDDYKLISRYRVTDPSFAEVTKGQALVLPVIENVDSIYVLDCSKSIELDSSDADEEGGKDEKITIKGQQYKKAEVVKVLNEMGVSVKESNADSTIIRAINKLSDDEETAFLAAIAEHKYSA